MSFVRVCVLALAMVSLGGCASGSISHLSTISVTQARPPATGLDGLIARYADLYDVPEALIRRIIVRESGYNPRAHHGPYWGLMQIRYDTAQSMGYRGPASGLLDAEINLTYGVKYLRGAWLLSNGNLDRAVTLYAKGFYYVAKSRGMLAEVGLSRPH